MPLGHAAAIVVDELARADPCRGELYTGFAHPAGDRVAAQTGKTLAAQRREARTAARENCRNHGQRFDVVDQRRASEQP